MANKVVFWSGGLDSTFAIWKLINDGHHVTACYIKISNNKNKVKRELKAIDAMLKYFPKNKFQYAGVIMNYTLNVNKNEIAIKQGILWINTAVFISSWEQVDEIVISYVMNDSAISYLTELKNIYASYQQISTSKMIPINFLLTKTSKKDILKKLPRKFLNKIVYCEREDDDKDDCGDCDPCLKMKMCLKQTGIKIKRK